MLIDINMEDPSLTPRCVLPMNPSHLYRYVPALIVYLHPNDIRAQSSEKSPLALS
jgi:hypothetical protein